MIPFSALGFLVTHQLILSNLALAASPPSAQPGVPPVVGGGVLDLIASSGLVVQLVLIFLLSASVFCWAIIIGKGQALRRAGSDDQLFLNFFWKSKSLEEIFSKSDDFGHSPIAGVFKSGFKELQKLPLADRASGADGPMDPLVNVQRSLLRAASTAMGQMEKHLAWLATTASAAPFVGLFGTVWGIMNSFRNIGATGSANLAVVAPGISEALIATAVGLATAIPAVIAYNAYVNRIKKMAVDMECFSQDFLNIIQRGLLAGIKKK